MFRKNHKDKACFKKPSVFSKIAVIILLVLAVSLLSTHAVHALSFPTGITNYLALNISNSQTTATPSPFQQMINVTSADSGWTYINTNQTTAFGQNVEFFYANGTIIPSWLENYTSGHAIWWVKTGSIAANSKITIYMGFATKTTNLFNNKTTGEAPTLSSTYAEYDDGANVFNFYDNFAGTSLNTSKWSSNLGSGGTITVNNGLTISSTTNYDTFVQSVNTYSNPQIVESYITASTPTTNYERVAIFTGTGSTTNENIVSAGYYYSNSYVNGHVWEIGYSSGGDKISTTTSLSGIVGGVWVASGNEQLFYNYQNIISWTDTSQTFGSTYIGLDVAGVSGGYSATFQWVRTRAYPPSGAMPSVTFGSVQTISLTLYLNGVSNANATITYGTESNFTAVISSSTDYVSLYVNGTKVVSLTQSKAIYLKTLAAGLYKITAATNTSGVSNQTYYEKINKATPTLSATVNGKALGSYTIRDANLSLSGNISALNPLTVDFYDNGKLLGTSPQTIIYSFSTLGNNVIVFNTSGNQNYSAASITGTINLTTNQFIIQDIAQNSSELSTFNLTISNSTATKSYTNMAYDTAILYSSLPQGTDTFNFSNSAYNWTAVSQSNSIFTATNTTILAKQWEWIYFNAKVSQTGLALANYTFNLSDTNAFKYLANASSQAKLSLQKLYSGTATVTIIKVGYNTTTDKIAFTSLSPSTNTYTITVSEAALFINVYDWLNLQAFNNVSSIQITNGTASKILSNQTVPVSLLASQIPLGYDTVSIAKTGYATSNTYIYINTHTAVNLSAYLVLKNDTTTLTFQVQNSFFQIVAGAVVYVENYFQSSNHIIAECQTTGSGQCQILVYPLDSYTYYAAQPDTSLISQSYPLYPVQSGSAGSCPANLWCAYISTVLNITAVQGFFSSFLTAYPLVTYLNPGQIQAFNYTITVPENDMNMFKINYSVINTTNSSAPQLYSSQLYTFNNNPSFGQITFNKTIINESGWQISVQMAANVNGTWQNRSFTYYIGQSFTGGFKSPYNFVSIFAGLLTGLGATGAFVFFLLILLAVTVLIWVLTGSTLITMLTQTALLGFFAAFNVFNLAIGSMGTGLGYALFVTWAFFTIMYQLTKVGGMG